MMRNQLVGLLFMAGATYAFAGMLEPEFPEAKITVEVVDESGIPIADANVGVGFGQGGNAWIGEYKTENIRGLSDSNGLFSAQARVELASVQIRRGFIIVTVNKIITERIRIKNVGSLGIQQSKSFSRKSRIRYQCM